MFYNSLLEAVPERRANRCWATLISFMLQVAGVGVLVVVPLLYTGALPPIDIGHPGFTLPAMPHHTPEATVQLTAVPPSLAGDSGVVYNPASYDPTAIRRPGGGVHQVSEGPYREGPEVDGPNIGLDFPCDGCPTGSPDRVIKELVAHQPTRLPQDRVKAVVVSHIDEGMLLVRVEPQYPTLARQARIQGSVVLGAIISRDGFIERLHMVSGHPMLVPAAMTAVRQWRYRPYILNDQAVEVETLITVNFVLGK